MAIINCPECGHMVSDSAEACPNCGYGVANYFSMQRLNIERQEWETKKKEKAKEEDQRLRKCCYMNRYSMQYDDSAVGLGSTYKKSCDCVKIFETRQEAKKTYGKKGCRNWQFSNYCRCDDSVYEVPVGKYYDIDGSLCDLGSFDVWPEERKIQKKRIEEAAKQERIKYLKGRYNGEIVAIEEVEKREEVSSTLQSSKLLNTQDFVNSLKAGRKAPKLEDVLNKTPKAKAENIRENIKPVAINIGGAALMTLGWFIFLYFFNKYSNIKDYDAFLESTGPVLGIALYYFLGPILGCIGIGLCIAWGGKISIILGIVMGIVGSIAGVFPFDGDEFTTALFGFFMGVNIGVFIGGIIGGIREDGFII
jgi:hypothetical protein